MLETFFNEEDLLVTTSDPKYLSWPRRAERKAFRQKWREKNNLPPYERPYFEGMRRPQLMETLRRCARIIRQPMNVDYYDDPHVNIFRLIDQTARAHYAAHCVLERQELQDSSRRKVQDDRFTASLTFALLSTLILFAQAIATTHQRRLHIRAFSRSHRRSHPTPIPQSHQSHRSRTHQTLVLPFARSPVRTKISIHSATVPGVFPPGSPAHSITPSSNPSHLPRPPPSLRAAEQTCAPPPPSPLSLSLPPPPT